MKKLTVLTFVVVSLQLTGCAGVATGSINKDLTKYTDVRQLIKKLGVPSQKAELFGDDIYVWRTTKNGSYAIPSTTYSADGSTAVTAYQTNSYSSSCEISVTTHHGEPLIIDHNAVGGWDGCFNWMVKLDNENQ